MKASSNDKVSVVMSAFNHAPYVGAAIESVLSQCHENIEFLIADDGSSDGTADVISQYKDPRITFLPSRINRGACTSTNDLIKMASGEFLCIINSDDIWPSTSKINNQLKILKSLNHVVAVFGRASYMNETGKPLQKEGLEGGFVFDQANRNRGEWLEHFFMLGNCLCHPSIMIRKNYYDKHGYYKNELRQVPDFEMWIRLVKQYDIYVSDETYVCFRLVKGKNTSSNLGKNFARIVNEHYLVNKSFFAGISDETFIMGFSHHFKNSEAATRNLLEIEKMLLFFNDKSVFSYTNQIIGLEKIYDMLTNEVSREKLLKHYGIDDHWIHEKSSEILALCEHTWIEPEVARLRSDNILLKQKIISMEMSSSWKVTLPFRAIMNFLCHKK